MKKYKDSVIQILIGTWSFLCGAVYQSVNHEWWVWWIYGLGVIGLRLVIDELYK